MPSVSPSAVSQPPPSRWVGPRAESRNCECGRGWEGVALVASQTRVVPEPLPPAHTPVTLTSAGLFIPRTPLQRDAVCACRVRHGAPAHRPSLQSWGERWSPSPSHASRLPQQSRWWTAASRRPMERLSGAVAIPGLPALGALAGPWTLRGHLCLSFDVTRGSDVW